MYISVSSIFEKQGKAEIGLKFPTSSLSPDLKTGVTFAIFNASGKVPFSKERLKICSNTGSITQYTSLITLTLILSIPGLLFDSKDNQMNVVIYSGHPVWLFVNWISKSGC